MQSKVTIKTTGDGSTTLFVPELDEHYHSVYGAMNESLHVFIKAGLNSFPDKETIKVFEVGFGTGLNAYLTWLKRNNSKIHYCAIEKYPLHDGIINIINPMIVGKERDIYLKLHQVAWGKWEEIDQNFLLKKIQGDLRDIDIDETGFDLIYFDAFAPDKHPDLWTESVFNKMYSLLAPSGYLVTYCAKGLIRRMLQDVGFNVERLPGPPPKKEMLRAQKITS